jgi:hypothetical protein
VRHHGQLFLQLDPAFNLVLSEEVPKDVSRARGVRAADDDVEAGGWSWLAAAVEALASDALIVAHPLRLREPPANQFTICHVSPL